MQLAQAQAATQAASQARRIDVSALPTGAAANDADGAGGISRTTKVLATTSGGSQVNPVATGPNRTLGIGNRFKSAPPRALDRSTEKHP